MAWVWQAEKHRYVDGKRVLTEREMLSIRNTIADGMTEESAGLATKLVTKVISLAEWARDFAKLLTNGIASAFMFGRGGKAAMDETATATLSGLIADQHGYAKDFVKAIAAELDNAEPQLGFVAARSELYSGAAVNGFHVGQSLDYGFSFEAYPADGTSECGGNCRCELIITDENESNWAVTWQTVGDFKVCPTCEDRGVKWVNVLVPKAAA